MIGCQFTEKKRKANLSTNAYMVGLSHEKNLRGEALIYRGQDQLMRCAVIFCDVFYFQIFKLLFVLSIELEHKLGWVLKTLSTEVNTGM